MPLPTPRTGEASNAFVSRCIEFLANENSAIPAGAARAAACYARLRKARPGAAPKKEEVLEILAKMDLDCEDCIFEIADEVLKVLEDTEIQEIDEALKQFEPPEAGAGAPKGVKDILRAVYNSCRSKWVAANPGDKENATNKTSCAKQAWAAVGNAGWKKIGGKWTKKMEDYDEIELPEQLKPVDARKEEKFTFLEPKIEKASTTNTPAWGSIAHNQSDHPNKSDFIVQRGDTWSDWKLPYKYKGKIHCGGVRAAYATSRGARGGVKGGLTPEEKARLESARRACGFAKEEDEVSKAYLCECIKCGYKTESKEHCRDIKCQKCGGEMRRAERPGPGKETDDQIVETVEGMIPEDIFHPLPDQPANPSIVNTEWPELEEVDLPKHLQPSYERSNLEELEDLLNKP